MIGTLVIIILALILISAAVAPLESLSWWAWDDNEDQPDSDLKKKMSPKKSSAQHYMIYFSGIGAISGSSVPQEEYPFLEELQRRLPKTKLITNIFPYAMANNGLTGERFFAKIWKFFEKKRFKNPNTLLAMIINLRNMFQMFVSADGRYGPIYNFGISKLIYEELLKNGYQPGSKVPITMLGWSGGGQISIGAAHFLAKTGSPIYVMSVGGMLSNDVGLDKVSKLWHLFGSKDPVQASGQYLFAGRWPSSRDSHWNRAVRDGRIKLIKIGPHVHMGEGNYYDLSNQIPSQGVSYGEMTLRTIVEEMKKQGLEKP